jgi:hypothetical protein
MIQIHKINSYFVSVKLVFVIRRWKRNPIVDWITTGSWCERNILREVLDNSGLTAEASTSRHNKLHSKAATQLINAESNT